MYFSPFHSVEKIDNLCDRNLPTSPLNQAPPLPISPTSASNDKPIIGGGAPPPTAKNQSLKQRINSLVVKTLAENQEKDKHQNSLQPASATKAQTNTAVVQKNLFTGDTWKIKVLQNTRVISNVKEASFVCEAIAKSGPSPDQQTVISMDCEGINLGIKGQITIIEVSHMRQYFVKLVYIIKSNTSDRNTSWRSVHFRCSLVSRNRCGRWSQEAARKRSSDQGDPRLSKRFCQSVCPVRDPPDQRV